MPMSSLEITAPAPEQIPRKVLKSRARTRKRVARMQKSGINTRRRGRNWRGFQRGLRGGCGDGWREKAEQLIRIAQ